MYRSEDIKLTFGDRVIGLFSPSRLERRVQQKETAKAMDIAMRGLFKASERNRLNADWVVPISFDINRVLQTELPLMRARSRWLMVNNSDAKSAQNGFVNYIVGTGFDLQMNVHSTVRGEDGEPTVTEFSTYNSVVEQVFEDWADDVCAITPDNSPMSHFEFQVMALERWIQDGEVFVHLIPHKTKILQLEFIEPEALDVYKTSNGKNPVILGVEVHEKTGKPVAYWINKKVPGEFDTFATGESVRIPAERIVHSFIRKYPRQLRGIPWMSASMERMNQIEGYRFAQLVRNKIAAFFGVIFTGSGGGIKKLLNDGESTSENGNLPTDANGNPISTLSPGLVGSAPNGVEPKMINPTSPETSYHDFMRSLLSSSGSGFEFGMSYQTMTRDSTGVSFAGGRMITQMDMQGFRPAQKMFRSKLLSPIHRVFMEYAILAGAFTASNFFNDPSFWTRHEWLPAGWSFGINPVQEVKASKDSMDASITTLVDECSKLGLDWKTQLRKQKKVRDYMSLLKIPLPTVTQKATEETLVDPEELEAADGK